MDLIESGAEQVETQLSWERQDHSRIGGQSCASGTIEPLVCPLTSNGRGQGELKAATHKAPEFSVREVGLGTPIYFSKAPSFLSGKLGPIDDSQHGGRTKVRPLHNGSF